MSDQSQYDDNGLPAASMPPPAAGGIPDDGSNPAAGQAGMGSPPQAGGIPDVYPTPDNVNPPEGNAIQAGVKKLTTPLGPIQPTGQSQTGAGGNPAATSEDLQKSDISGASPHSRVASMVMGEGAAPLPVLRQAAKAVDPQNTQPPGNQNMMAIDAEVQKGNMKGALALAQANRVAWGSQQGFALSALTGTQGKGPDLNAAIDAANKAEQHVLDGSNVKFSHAGDGNVTATVTMATGGEPQTIKLTTDQFKQFLNVGDNHWDKLMNRTVPATLQMLANGQMSVVGTGKDASGAPVGKTASPAGNTGGDDDEDAPRMNVGARRAPGGNTDPWAQQYENEHGTERTKFDPNTDDEVTYRSHRMFPNSQLSGTEPQRQEWVAKQQESEAERKNKMDVEVKKDETSERNWDRRMKGAADVQDRKNTGNKDVATIKADSFRDTSGNKLEGQKLIAAQRQEAQQAKHTEFLMDQARKTMGASDSTLGKHFNAMHNNPLHEWTPEDLAEEKAWQDRVTGTSKNARAGAPPAPGTAVPTGKAAPPPTGQGAVNTQPDHDAAIKWARDNPNDPKSARILQLHGLQ